VTGGIFLKQGDAFRTEEVTLDPGDPITREILLSAPP
jgi:hypothetical protein